MKISISFEFTRILLVCFLCTSCVANAQWTQTKGPYGGYVNALTVSGSYLYAGTYGGVFLSTNSGTSWTEASNGLTNQTVYSLVVSGSNLYAGTYGGGVFLSTDNGISWTEASNGLTNQRVRSLAVSGSNLYAGTEGGVFHSTNSGTSWTEASNGLTNQTVYSLVASGSNLYAGTEGGVFLSTNSGASWTEASNGLTNQRVRSLAVSGSNLYAGTEGGVFLSTNSSTSWTEASSGLTNQTVYSLAVSGSNLYAGTYGGGVFHSTNSGTSWTAARSGLINNVLSLAVSDSNLYAGTEGGVFHSTNSGTSWTAASTGLTNAYVWSLAVSGSNLYAGTYGGVFLSTNNGTSWTAVSSGLTNQTVYSLVVSGSNLYAGTYGGGVFRSTNNGTSWTAASSGLTSTLVLSLTVSGSNLYAGTNGGGVFLSTNNGTSWTAASSGLTNQTIHSLAVSGGNLYAGTYGGGVFLSTNNGTSWTAASSSLTNAYVYSFAVSGSNLYAGTDGGVFLSTNNGTSWTAASSGLPNQRVWSFAVSDSNLYAGTDGGVFLSTNNGSSWTAVNTGLSNLSAISLAVSGSNLYAGTYGSSLFTMSTAQVQLGGVSNASLCTGDTLRVPYSVSRSFAAGNIFSVQLSDSTGSFAAPQTIGTITSIMSDTVKAVVPQTITGGTRYRIRVVSSNPTRITSDNGANITLGLRPQPVITGTAGVCDKQSGAVYSVASAAGTMYTWQSPRRGSITSGSSTNSITCTWNSAGLDTIRMRQTNTVTGCFMDTSFVVTINPLPTPVITGSQSVCANQQRVVYSTPSNSGSTYQWRVVSGNASINGVATSNSVTIDFGAMGAAQLNAEETTSAGCTRDTILSVTIGSGLTPTITSNRGVFSYCAGSSVTLDAGLGGDTYQWKRGGADIGGATQQTYIVTQAGSYSVSVVKNGCSGTSTTQAVTEIATPIPTITQSGTTLRTEVYDIYQWMDSAGVAIAGATDQTYSPTASGVYSVRVQQQGCTGVALAGYRYTMGAPGGVTVGTCDFGNQVISPIINSRGGHRNAIVVWNRSGTKVVMTSAQVVGSTEFSVVANQFPREVEAGDSAEFALSFAPVARQQYAADIQVSYNGLFSQGRVLGSGIDLPSGSTVTEVALQPNKQEIAPGETLMVYLLITREEPISSIAKEFTSTIDYDVRVLEYLATDHVRSLPAPADRDRKMLEIQHRRGGSDTLIGVRFVAKLAEVDSTSLLFNGAVPFKWVDGNGKVFPAYADSVVRIKICREGGKRLVTKSPGTQVLSMSPHPGTDDVRITYTTGEEGYVDVYVSDIYGNRVSTIKSGQMQMGNHTSHVCVRDWPDGTYFIVIRTGYAYVSEMLVVVR